MTIIRFEDNALMNDLIYPVVMTFDGERVEQVRMADVIAACKESAARFGDDNAFNQIFTDFVRYVGDLED